MSLTEQKEKKKVERRFTLKGTPAHATMRENKWSDIYLGLFIKNKET